MTQVSKPYWNATDETERFNRLRAIGFSKHDAGIMSMLKFDKLPKYVQTTLQAKDSQ